MQFLCVKLLSVKQIDQAWYGRSDSLHTYSCAMQDNVPCRLSIYNGQQFELAVDNPQYQDARVKKNSFSRCGEVNKQIGREQKKAIEQIPVEIKFSPTTVCKYSDFVVLVHRNRIMREKSEKGFEEILNKLYLPVFTLINSLSHFYLEDTPQTILKISTLLRIHYHINKR